MKNLLKYIAKRVISGILHVFWIFPIKKDKILFMNDHSYTFSDNLKYLCLDMLKKDPDKYQIFFSLQDTNEIKEKKIHPVKFLSLSHFFHALTSGTVITNNSGIVYLPIRKKQLIINTWHGGGPYKVTGLEALDNFWYEKELQYSAKKFDYILSSCKVFTELEAPGMYYKPEQIINCGMPRMDFFFDQEAMQEARRKVFEKYNMDSSQKLVLYAPTFRGYFEDYNGVVAEEALEIDYQRLKRALSDRFGGDWFFAVRLHPRLKDIKFKKNDFINMTFYQDAEELLMAADALITDYSSVMWDFSFSGKPIFLFATDINEYEVKRGFYMPPESWPFPIASSNDELENVISNYDYNEYIEKLNAHYVECDSYEKGVACEIVEKIISEHAKLSI